MHVLYFIHYANSGLSNILHCILIVNLSRIREAEDSGRAFDAMLNQQASKITISMDGILDGWLE